MRVKAVEGGEGRGGAGWGGVMGVGWGSVQAGWEGWRKGGAEVGVGVEVLGHPGCPAGGELGGLPWVWTQAQQAAAAPSHLRASEVAN